MNHAAIAPLSVKVIDESDAAAVNVIVRFALFSVRGGLLATDGNEKVAVTDSLGIAAWEGLAVWSGARTVQCVGEYCRGMPCCLRRR